MGTSHRVGLSVLILYFAGVQRFRFRMGSRSMTAGLREAGRAISRYMACITM